MPKYPAYEKRTNAGLSGEHHRTRVRNEHAVTTPNPVVADSRALALGVRADGATGAQRQTSDDRDGERRAIDGARGAL
jgi:hypothetical protein